MQTIKLTTTKEVVTVPGKGKTEMDFDIAGLIRTACNQPTKGGLSANDLRNRIRIIDAVDTAEVKSSLSVAGEEKPVAVLELEDADYKNLGALVSECRWGIVSKTILSFVDSFK